jgi:hypothetical protein
MDKQHGIVRCPMRAAIRLRLNAMKLSKYNRHYVSELTGFINDFKQQHPDLDKKQREARAIWWDKPPLTPDEVRRASTSDVKLKPYVYD